MKTQMIPKHKLASFNCFVTKTFASSCNHPLVSCKVWSRWAHCTECTNWQRNTDSFPVSFCFVLILQNELTDEEILIVFLSLPFFSFLQNMPLNSWWAHRTKYTTWLRNTQLLCRFLLYSAKCFSKLIVSSLCRVHQLTKKHNSRCCHCFLFLFCKMFLQTHVCRIHWLSRKYPP